MFSRAIEKFFFVVTFSGEKNLLSPESVPITGQSRARIPSMKTCQTSGYGADLEECGGQSSHRSKAMF